MRVAESTSRRHANDRSRCDLIYPPTPSTIEADDVTSNINIALLGSKFMGRAHSNAWLNVAKFFDVDPRPTMHTVVGRNATELAEFATRWGWQQHTTDWRAAVTSDEIGLVDIG